MAEKLIKKDLAYVCVESENGNTEEASLWKNRPMEDSLQDFRVGEQNDT